MVDLEQLVIADPAHFTYPLWPPRLVVDAYSLVGQYVDSVLEAARPVWWKMTIWIGYLLYGPFYLVAIGHAYIKGKEWIRLPSIFYGGMLFATVIIILGEEKAGPHASPELRRGAARQPAVAALPADYRRACGAHLRPSRAQRFRRGGRRHLFRAARQRRPARAAEAG